MKNLSKLKYIPGRVMCSRIMYSSMGSLILIVMWALIGFIVFSRPGYEQFSGFLPIPTIKAMYGLLFDMDFWMSVISSLRRVIIGIVIAFAVGLPFGLIIGFYKQLQQISYTPIQFLRMISPVSWMPIALLVFEGFESAIYFLITMATIWPIILNTIQGVMNVNPQWLSMARNQGATDFQLLRHIVLPSSVPFILTSLRLSLGVAWIVLVPAEFLGVSSGLGYMINDARDTMEYERLMAIVISIGILGFALDGLIDLLQRTCRWSTFGQSS